MSKVKGRHVLIWGGTIYRIWVNANTTAKPTMQFDSPQEFVNDQLSTVTIVNATPGNGVRATQIGLSSAISSRCCRLCPWPSVSATTLKPFLTTRATPLGPTTRARAYSGL